MRPWLRVALLALGFYYIEEAGAPPPASHGARAYISNHINGVPDGLFLLWRLSTGCLAEASNFPPLLRPVALALGITLLDRSDPAGARGALAAAMRDPACPPPLVFPEAACSSGARLLAFKSGAGAALLPLAPVVLAYPNAHLDVSWTLAGPSLPALLARMLCAGRLRLRARWLPAQAPAPGEAPAAFVERLRAAMGAAGGLPLVRWGSEDVRMAGEALALRARGEVGLVDFERLRSLVELAPPQGASASERAAHRAALRDILRAFVGELRAAQGGGSGGGSSSGGGGGGGGGTTIGFAQFKHFLLVLRELQRARSRGSGGGGGGGGGGAGAGAAEEPPASPISALLQRPQAAAPPLPTDSIEDTLTWRLFCVS